jgi:signal transduction histidine kinase
MVRISRYEQLLKDARRITHTFNNKLTPLSGLVSIIQMQTTDSKINETLNILASSIEDMAKEVKNWQNSLSTESRISSHPSKHTKIEFRNYLRQFPILAKPYGIEYRLVEFNIGTPGKEIWVDLDFVHDATMNMIRNAQQAQATKITNRYRTRDNYLFTSFKDNGQGMDKETCKKCFDPGFTTKLDGHGIGLSYLSEYLKKIGGYALAKSELGKGAEFILAQPIGTLINPPVEEKK